MYVLYSYNILHQKHFLTLNKIIGPNISSLYGYNYPIHLMLRSLNSMYPNIR